MKKGLIGTTLVAGLLVAAGSAHALTFNEVENGSTFARYFTVTPTAASASGTTLSVSLSGLGDQFSALSFSFVGIPGLSVTAKQGGTGSWLAAFNDARNSSFNLVKGTAYKVLVSGTTIDHPGTQGTVSFSSLNGVIAAVPEPDSYAMLLAGLGLMVGIARRRRDQRA